MTIKKIIKLLKNFTRIYSNNKNEFTFFSLWMFFMNMKDKS